MTDEQAPRTRRSQALGGSDIGRCLTAIHHDRFTPSTVTEDAVRDRLLARGRSFEDKVVEEIQTIHSDTVSIPYRTRRQEAVDRTLQAMEVGTPVILGGRLVGTGGNGVGFPDLLVRMGDGYTAVEIKSHKAIGDNGPPAAATTLDQLPTTDGRDVRFRSNRRRDLLQVAHYRSLLRSAGYLTSEPFGGVIGTDDPLSCVWVDLTSGDLSVGDEYAHYLAMADGVIQHGTDQPDSPLIPAHWRGECTRCTWSDLCKSQLEMVGDPTLLRGVGATLREDLRSEGVSTIAEIASLEIDDARIPNSDIVTQARAITSDRLLRLDNGQGAVDLPTRPREVDFDIETINGRVYLAGLLITENGTSRFDPVVDWEDSDDAERRLLIELFAKLAQWGEDTIVYHWTGYESRTLSAAARHHGIGINGYASVEDWFTERAFDLYEWTRANFVSPRGYSLKVIAPMCGFGWRDDDPGGLQSEIWYESLQAGDGSMAERLLAYNEDDVIAQREVRRWVRDQDSGDGPGSSIPSVTAWPAP